MSDPNQQSLDWESHFLHSQSLSLSDWHTKQNRDYDVSNAIDRDYSKMSTFICELGCEKGFLQTKHSLIE